LNSENLSAFVAWANLPDSIRGYGHVKERSIAAARLREKELIEQILADKPVIHGVESWQPSTVIARQLSEEERDVMEAS
jgi:indolepyruvate ferredoxin oxidoreductase